jgi:Type II secretion system (T2SS), protein E, N-terminal domain
MAIRLGDLLIKAKVINETQLKAALAEQQKWGGKLGELLVRMSFLTEDMLVKALSKQMGVPSVNLEVIVSVPPHVRSKIPEEVARELGVVPLQLRDEHKTLLVAMADPQNLKHLDTLRSVSRCRITAQLAGRQAIARAFGRIYEGDTELSVSSDPGFKFINSQGATLIKNPYEGQPGGKRPRPETTPPPPPRLPPRPDVPSAQKSPHEALRAIEEAQRKEVTALKGMVELLIEKGVFTRDEYLAKVKR